MTAESDGKCEGTTSENFSKLVALFWHQGVFPDRNNEEDETNLIMNYCNDMATLLHRLWPKGIARSPSLLVRTSTPSTKQVGNA